MPGVVPSKGRCSHAVRRMEGMLDQLGHMKYILKSDQEPAIIELKELIRRGRDDDIIMEESLVEYSRSHWCIERAIQAVQDHIRTMKSALEGITGEDIRPDHPGLPWLVMHSSNIINRYKKGVDGCTAHIRSKEKEFNGTSLDF